MATNDTELRISADASSVEKGMQQAAAAVKSSVEQMNSSLSNLGGAFSKLQGYFVAMTAVLAGGAAFKSAIDATTKWNSEVVGLSKGLGINTDKAATLNYALQHLGISSETYTGAADKMYRQLQKNAPAFETLGIKTKGANGQWRSAGDIMPEVIEKLNGIHNTTQKNIAGQQLFSKGWTEVRSILKVAGDELAHAAQRVKELGLSTTPAQVRTYNESMNDLGLVATALSVQLGNALIPTLTAVGAFMSAKGPAATKVFSEAVEALNDVILELKETVVQVFSAIGDVVGSFGTATADVLGTEVPDGLTILINMIKVVRVVFVELGAGIRIVFESLKTAIYSAMVYVNQFVLAVSRLVRFDAAGAKQAWADGMKAISDEVEKSAARILKIEEDAAAKMNKILLGENKAKPAPTGGSQDDPKGLDFSKGAKEAKDQIAIWKAALEAKKEVEGQYFKDSLQSDIAYWDEKLNHVKHGSKEERAVKHDLYALHKQDAQANLAAEIATIDYQMAVAKNDTAKKVNLAKQEADLIKKTYGEKSKEYIGQLRKVEEAERAHKETMDKLELERLDHAKAMKVSALEQERETLRFQKEMGDISAAQELTALRALKEAEFQIEMKAAKDKLDFIKDDVVAKQKALDDIAQMEAKHGIEMNKNAHDTALAIKGAWEKMLDPITSAFDTSIKGMIQGTTTLQKAMANIGNAIAAEFVNLGLKMVKNWATTELAKTNLTQTGTVMRTALEKLGLVQTGALQKAAATQTVSTKAAEATGVVGANAAEAASGAAASQASIPVVGWGLAIAAFAGVMAMVMGAKSSIPSARGGYDIPAGINPLTQLHEREMVLPAGDADVIRGLSGGDGQAGGAVHLRLHTPDTAAARRFLMDNRVALAAAIKAAHRDGSLGRV